MPVLTVFFTIELYEHDRLASNDPSIAISGPLRVTAAPRIGVPAERPLV